MRTWSILCLIKWWMHFFGKSIALDVETRLDDARFVPFEPVLIRVPGYTRTIYLGTLTEYGNSQTRSSRICDDPVLFCPSDVKPMFILVGDHEGVGSIVIIYLSLHWTVYSYTVLVVPLYGIRFRNHHDYKAESIDRVAYDGYCQSNNPSVIPPPQWPLLRFAMRLIHFPLQNSVCASLRSDRIWPQQSSEEQVKPQRSGGLPRLWLDTSLLIVRIRC